MSSSQPFLAYLFKQREDPASTRRRIEQCEAHLKRSFHVPLDGVWVGDGASGFVGWSPTESRMNWEPFTVDRQGRGVGWLHVPAILGREDLGLSPRSAAEALRTGDVTAGDMGAPFALAYWSDGWVELRNDVLGLVRLFHFDFETADVWTTRPGLAHVFAGELPRRNDRAWHGMAAIGWAASGLTQLGEGRQMPPATTVVGGFRGAERVLSVQSRFGEWFSVAREQEVPSAAERVRDIEAYMRTASRWGREVIADLSGGKDSRVVAAAGLRSGVVSVVRTVANDSGEVETARRLVECSPFPVQHRIVEPVDPSLSEVGFADRMRSVHRAWEGRYLAPTAYRSSPFRGFPARSAPKFNGLGGEVMAGGNLIGQWQRRLAGRGARAALDKFRAMSRLSSIASENAEEATTEELSGYADLAISLGSDEAASALDLAYNLDKMPNWSITFGTFSTLTPLFSSGVLRYAMSNVGNPVDPGEAHRELLQHSIAPWSEVPFYKPSVQRRAFPFMWENDEWTEVERFARDHVGSSSCSPAAVERLLRMVKSGEASKREEIAMQRFLWDATFDSYLSEVEQDVRSARAVYSSAHRRSGGDVRSQNGTGT